MPIFMKAENNKVGVDFCFWQILNYKHKLSNFCWKLENHIYQNEKLGTKENIFTAQKPASTRGLQVSHPLIGIGETFGDWF